MHPEPIGLLCHVFLSLTFPVILGPNITGEFWAADGTGSVPAVGAFYPITENGGGIAPGGYTVTHYGFEASRVSDKYNESTTNHPVSGYSIIIIKA